MAESEPGLRRAKRCSGFTIPDCRAAGFTLVEVMLVVGIIGALASIAMPNMQKAVFRARRNEAQLNLKGIYQAEKLYFTEHGVYGSTFPAIGFEILGGKPLDANTIESKYYTYTLEALAVGGISNSNYSAVATGNIDPSDSMLDILVIESGLVVIQ